MDSAKFEVLCKQIVMDYANKHLDKSDNAEITEMMFMLYGLVRLCKITKPY